GAGRTPFNPEDALASGATISRLEHAASTRDIYRASRALVEQFIAGFAQPPSVLVLDMDHSEDAVYGQQPLAFYNHHYQSTCYLPVMIFEGLSGALVAAVLRPGKRPTGAENAMILKRVLTRIRAHFPDTQILVRGDLVMDGYWNRQQDTESVLRDGWLHTGDIGELDHGYLRITDRKKDMIVLSGGENVSPAKIEGMLMAETEIAQAVVAGDGRSGVSALVVPADGYDDVAVALAVNRTNLRLSVTERIRKHAVVPPFTIENGLLTPSQKIRRVLVIRANAHVLARPH
ncbi:MAG: hypothetical protein B7Z80_11805, partial [Rhodospirillales bacterium 20-64-7]